MLRKLTIFRAVSLLAVFSASAFARATPPAPVPEPGALILLASGIAGVILLARKKMKK